MKLMKFLLGLVIGAGVALLVAPKSGRELRQQLVGGATSRLLPAAPVEYPQPEHEREWGGTAATAVAEAPEAAVADVWAPEPVVVVERPFADVAAQEPVGEDLKVRIDATRAVVESEIAQPFAAVDVVTAEDAAEAVEEAVVADAVAEEAVAEAVVAEAVAEEAVAEAVIAEAVAEEAVSQMAVDDAVAEEAVAEAVVAEAVAEEAVVEAAVAEAVAEEAVAEAVVAEVVAEEVVVEAVVAEPIVAEPVVDEPVIEAPPVWDAPPAAETAVEEAPVVEVSPVEERAPVVAEPPAVEELPVVEQAPAAGVAGLVADIAAPAAPVTEPPVADEPVAEETPERTGGAVDQAEMRRRIEETRARLKAKAFDAMMSGESALLSRDSGDKPVPSGEDVKLDAEIDSTIDESLSQEDY
jgi:transcription termination factor Rho